MTPYVKSSDEVARQIASALIEGRSDFPLEIDKTTYNILYDLMRVRFPDLKTRVLILDDTVECQFSSISSDVFTLTDGKNLTSNSFTADCNVVQAATTPPHWLKALACDALLMRWAIIPIILLSGVLMAFQSPKDLNSYFTTSAQVLALIFTLYAVYRQALMSNKPVNMQHFRIGYIDQMYHDERVIGLNAMGTIVLCLIELLLTSSSINTWDESNPIIIGSVQLNLVHIGSVILGVLASLLLASFLRSIVFYYPRRERSERLWEGKNGFFSVNPHREEAISPRRPSLDQPLPDES